jgi:hypothetical protein
MDVYIRERVVIMHRNAAKHVQPERGRHGNPHKTWQVSRHFWSDIFIFASLSSSLSVGVGRRMRVAFRQLPHTTMIERIKY